MCTQQQQAAAIWCGKLHPRPVVDRLATPTPRTKYKADGIGPGAYVTGKGRYIRWGEYVDVLEPAQVWSRSSEGNHYWWVTTGERFVLMHEMNMTLVGHADADVPLEGIA